MTYLFAYNQPAEFSYMLDPTSQQYQYASIVQWWCAKNGERSPHWHPTKSQIPAKQISHVISHVWCLLYPYLFQFSHHSSITQELHFVAQAAIFILNFSCVLMHHREPLVICNVVKMVLSSVDMRIYILSSHAKDHDNIYGW